MADRPESRPVLASTKAPLHTDMVTSVAAEAVRIQPIIAGVAASRSIAGMTITLGWGADSKVWSGRTRMPPPTATGPREAATR